jgi:hypothetical protein
MRINVAVLAFLLASPASQAALPAQAPAVACAHLSSIGLATRGWKNHYDQQFGCSSAYKEIGSGSPLANNVAYYVEGGSANVKLAKLVLNINNRSSASSAHAELLKAAKALLLKLSDGTLPKEIESAILSGSTANAAVEAFRIKVSRSDWPTGKGYEVKVIFE